MICPDWKRLHTEFLTIVRAIERTNNRRLRGAQRNKQLNAAARASLEKLHHHERDHGCKPSVEELKADGAIRLEEAKQRVEALRRKTGK